MKKWGEVEQHEVEGLSQRSLLGLGRGTDSDMSDQGSSAEEADDEDEEVEAQPGRKMKRINDSQGNY